MPPRGSGHVTVRIFDWGTCPVVHVRTTSSSLRPWGGQSEKLAVTPGLSRLDTGQLSPPDQLRLTVTKQRCSGRRREGRGRRRRGKEGGEREGGREGEKGGRKGAEKIGTGKGRGPGEGRSPSPAPPRRRGEVVDFGPTAAAPSRPKASPWPLVSPQQVWCKQGSEILAGILPPHATCTLPARAWKRRLAPLTVTATAPYGHAHGGGGRHPGEGTLGYLGTKYHGLHSSGSMLGGGGSTCTCLICQGYTIYVNTHAAPPLIVRIESGYSWNRLSDRDSNQLDSLE